MIDCVHSGQTVQLSLDLLIKGGQLIVVGLFGGEITLPTPTLPMRAISIEGSYDGNIADLRELITLVNAQKIQPLPTQCCDLHQASSALQDLEMGKVIGRLILQPGA